MVTPLQSATSAARNRSRAGSGQFYTGNIRQFKPRHDSGKPVLELIREWEQFN
jgi:hypothetical protein